MKRLSIALAAAGLSAGAFAALPAATDPTVVNVPQLPGGFVVGVSGFYLQPTNTNGDLDYATVNTNTSGSNSSFFASGLQNVDPGYDWGWGVNVGYIFPNTGNDVNLSYFQLDTSDTASVSGTNFPIAPIANNFDELGLFDFTAGEAKAEYDINQVDLTAGQYIDVGCRLVLHPFAGLRWAQVDRTLKSGFASVYSINSTENEADVAAYDEESDFSGIGPLVGLDASYYVGMGFGVVGHFDSALLVGNISTKTNAAESFVVTSAGNGSVLNSAAAAATFTAGNTRRIVPVMDAKLGLDYTYVFNNSANSDLTLEAGWMVSNYFNAIDRLQTFGGSFKAQGVGASNGVATVAGRTTSDLGLQGPYVSLVFHA